MVTTRQWFRRDQGSRGFLAGAEKKHGIMLVSTSRRFTCYSALAPFVFGDFDEDDLSVDVTASLRERGVSYRNDKVLRVNGNSGSVRITENDIDGNVHSDKLIISIGRRLATEKIPGFFE